MRSFAKYNLMDAVGVADAGKTVLVKDFRHAIFSFATDGGNDANLTLKFQGAISTGASAVDNAPDFSAAQSVTNMWDFIEVVDLEDGSTIDGDTGITLAGADDYRLFEMNINGLEYVNVRITAYSEGELTIIGKFFND